MFTVVITEKGGAQKRLTFAEPEVTIGRVPGNDVVLPKGNVSKRHSRIVLKDNRFIVVDLKSTNGTYVNGRKITSPLVVKEGDKIYIGDFILTLEGDASLTAPSDAMKQPSAMPMSNGDGGHLQGSSPPPLPSRAPEPLADDLPPVLRSGSAPSSDPPSSSSTSVALSAPNMAHAPNGEAAEVDRGPVEQTNVVNFPAEEHTTTEALGHAPAGSLSAAPGRSIPAAFPRRTAPPLHELGNLGPLEPLLAENDVRHIVVERFDRIRVDRGKGLVLEEGASFPSLQALLGAARRLLALAGVSEGAESTAVDAALPNGVQLVIVMPNAASDGPVISLRRRPATPTTLAELTADALLNEEHEKALNRALEENKSVWVVGAPRLDAAPLVSALVAAYPAERRVALFERAPEVAIGERAAVCFKLGVVALDTLLERVRYFRPDRFVFHDLRAEELGPAVSALALCGGSVVSSEHSSSAQLVVTLEKHAEPSEIARAIGIIVELVRDGSGKARVAQLRKLELTGDGKLALTAHA